MDITAIVLIAISALLHAGWNCAIKHDDPSVAFFLLASIAGALCLTPALIVWRHALGAFPNGVWMLMVLTGLCQAAYYVGLAGAYRRGHLSVIYPIVRASPVIVVTIITILLGRRDQLSTQCVVGIALVAAGCVFVPMARFSDIRLRNYLNVAGLCSAVVALGTSGYSMIDDQALRELRNAPEMSVGNTVAVLMYYCLSSLTSSLWLSMYVLARRGDRGNLRAILRSGLGRPVITGVVMILGYTLVLVALAFAKNVSYVVAFRQLSIPIGTLLGVCFLREPRHVPKFVGTAVVCMGLVLVGTG